MQEILTLSLSQRSNHLTTHFYNAQESYFNYATPKLSQNDPTVHFRPSLQSNNTVNYHPRALIWDLNGGFGALGQFEYFPQRDSDNDVGPICDFSRNNVIQRQRVPKSAYQKALDSGDVLPELQADKVRYWSDFNRCVFEPKSYNVLQGWEYDPIDAPNGRLSSGVGQEREFKGFDVGLNEWDAVGTDFMENTYRVSLEECDGLNGVNLVAEVDSAWCGFSSGLIRDLRDDYLPKGSVFTWGLYDGRALRELSIKEVYNRIRGFVELAKDSSLFLPLGIPNYDHISSSSSSSRSLWEVSALQNLVFESLQTLNSNFDTKGKVNFNQIESALVRGTNRNVITDIVAEFDDHMKLNYTDKFFELNKVNDKKETHEFNKLEIHRPSRDHPDCKNKDNDNEATTATTTGRTTVASFDLKEPYPVPSSHPSFPSSSSKLFVSFATSSSARKSFLGMKDWVRRYVKGDERAELIDSLSMLAGEYEFGWGSDDEESDDDY